MRADHADPTMLIRPMHDADITWVAALLKQLALAFIVHESAPEARATFLRDNDESRIRRLVDGGLRYHVAVEDDALAGFIALRERRHLFHMFVDERWQRQGHGRRLWETARLAALADGASGVFTVNASNFAVPTYLALGFVPTMPTQCLNGLYFNPMRYDPA